jgi:O-antigen/teichoic acid export membrane protein
MSEGSSNKEPSDIGTRTLSALRWLSSGIFLGQMVSWAITLYVVRLLTPADYGLMAMAALFIGILQLFYELGLGAAIIQAREIQQALLQQLFALILLVNLALFGCLVLIAPAIAGFFDEPQLTSIVRWLSVQFLVVAFSIVPKSLLERELKFKERSMIEFSANLIASFTTLTLALSGKGVWALVAGSLVLTTVRTVGFNIFAPFFHPPVFSLQGTRRVFSFGGMILMERLLWYLYTQADTFIIGKLLGKELLGVYSVGKQITSLIAAKVAPILNQIAFPAFSRIQDNKKEVAYYTIKGVRIIIVLSVPAFWGISCVAPELIDILFGEKWILTVPTLIWRSFILPLSIASGMILTILKSLGKADISLKNIITASIIMPVAFVIGCQWGILGVSVAWTVGFPLYFFVTVYRSAPYLGVRMRDLLEVLVKPVIGALFMYGGVSLLREALKGYALSSGTLLGMMVVAGVVIYIAVEAIINRETVLELFYVAKRLTKRDVGKGSDFD